jgi:hypothetical protein
MSINLYKSIIVHDKAFEFFVNYLADAERTVELTNDISLKEFFPVKHGSAFDKHRSDEIRHATWLDEFLKECGFALFPMEKEFQVIAQFKRFINDKLFSRNKKPPFTNAQLAVWAAYFYCAERSAFESFHNLKKRWKAINHPRAIKAAEILERILLDEREHMKFAWNLTLENTATVSEARRLVKNMGAAYKKASKKTEALLISRLKDIIVSDQERAWSEKLIWRAAAFILKLNSRAPITSAEKLA